MLVKANNVGVGDAERRMQENIEARCALAFSCGCRLAVTAVVCPNNCCWAYEFVVLSPGERAPEGWTIYEQRDGRAVGRSA